MKKNVTYVASPKLVAIAQHLGATVTEQKGFLKITDGQNTDRAVYVGNGKGVGRIDISGFIHPMGATHDAPPTARVAQKIDMSADEVTILRTFKHVVEEGILRREGEAIVGKARASKTVAEPTAEEIAAAVAAACGE